MRSVFNDNMKKVKASKRSGIGSEEVYTPTYEHFDELLFTLGDAEPRQGISSLEVYENIVSLENSKKSASKKNKSQTTATPSNAQQLLDTAISNLNKSNEDDEIEGCLLILNSRLKKLNQEDKAVAIMDLLNVKSTFTTKNDN